MPYILFISAGILDDKFKTLRESKGRDCVLISPPEVEEVCLMAQAMMDVYPENDIFKN